MASFGMSKWGHWFWRTKVGPLPLVFFLGKEFETLYKCMLCTSELCFPTSGFFDLQIIIWNDSRKEKLNLKSFWTVSFVRKGKRK